MCVGMLRWSEKFLAHLLLQDVIVVIPLDPCGPHLLATSRFGNCETEGMTDAPNPWKTMEATLALTLLFETSN